MPSRHSRLSPRNRGSRSFACWCSADRTGYPAGEISEQLAIPGPTLSFHLKELSAAGLVSARKDGRFIHYSPNFERMRTLVSYLTDNCCSLAATCAPECTTPVAARRKRKSA